MNSTESAILTRLLVYPVELALKYYVTMIIGRLVEMALVMGSLVFPALQFFAFIFPF